MATARFETYVTERVKELAAPKRAQLEAAFKAEEAKVEQQRSEYLAMVEDGVEALVRKVVERAGKDGCATGATKEAEGSLSEYAKGKVRSMIGLQQEYDYDLRKSLWPKGSPARKAQDALLAFDELCEKEARRITVYKMDLGLKPEKFEKMLDEVAEKIKEA